MRKPTGKNTLEKPAILETLHFQDAPILAPERYDHEINVLLRKLLCNWLLLWKEGPCLIVNTVSTLD